MGGEVQVRGSLGTSLRGERCWVNYAAIRNYEQVQRCIRRSPDQPQNETQRRVACSSLAPRTHTKHPTCVLFRQHSPRKVRLAAARQPFRLNRLMTAVSFDKNTPSADSQGTAPWWCASVCAGPRHPTRPVRCRSMPADKHHPSSPPMPQDDPCGTASHPQAYRANHGRRPLGRGRCVAAWPLSWLPVPLFQVGSAIRQSRESGWSGISRPWPWLSPV